MREWRSQKRRGRDRPSSPPPPPPPSPPSGAPASRPPPCPLRGQAPGQSAPEAPAPAPAAPAPPAPAPPARRWARALLLGALVLAVTAPSPAAALSPSADLNSQKESGVCISMDIRNSPRMFQKLQGCRVVEGFLQILLFDHYNETAYANLSFPELREITGYLMMYRVNGLTTLSNLFPNLAVIRGHKLFNNYAFILYEMMHMQEIGLHSLTDISRGSVRIEKNYMMCYVNTINWDIIAKSGKEGNYIKDNKLENECPVCPGDDGTAVAGTPGICPEANHGSKEYSKKHLCWNRKHCQKVCKPECGGNACSASGECCDSTCLGGCSESMRDNCTVCRDLSIGDLHDRKCIKDCPANTYKHQDRRCISETECRNLSMPREMQGEPDKIAKSYKPINGTCMLECPPNFYEITNSQGHVTCERCQGTCMRECYGVNVDSIQAAEQLRGCTYIKGSLEISVRGGGSIVKELEDGLGQITDIQGSLKIARSFPLVSLNFLKSLRRIHGYDLNMRDVVPNAFSVTDNQNLQDLWDWEKHGPIEILHGKLFFHFNPKLCIEKIQPLKEMTKDTEFSDLEVARNSNGDKVACNVTLLNVTVVSRVQTSVLIKWDAFVHDDPRSLLGYVVYFIEAPHRNVTLYEGRDACGGDGWHVDDIQFKPKETIVYHILTHLKPYTQYAVYAKTYTIATERLGAQSDIIYVRTLPGQPSAPRILDVISPSPSSLFLRWDPPEQPHGNVTQYKVAVKWEEDREDFLQQRNYCNEPLVPVTASEKKSVVEVEKPKEKEPKDNGKCQCDSNGFRNDDEVIGQITFEDNLQNQVYQKREPAEETRRRRDIDATRLRYEGGPHAFPDKPAHDQPMPQENIETFKQNGSDTFDVFVSIIENQTSLNVTHLRHYAAHSISVWACREVEADELVPNVTELNNCSLKSIVRTRTLKLEGADEITDLNVRVQSSNQSLGVVKVFWKEPFNPNGLIVTYEIQYKRVDIENHKATVECITRTQFRRGDNSYTIKNLNAGNYSIMVMATSLAGNGNYTALKYFFIEESGSRASLQVVIGSVLGVLVVIIILGTAVFIVQRRCLPPPAPPPTKLIASVNPEYISPVYVPDDWEVLREDIELLKELGQGSFGMVYEGIARDIRGKPEIRCAVKTVNEHATDRERTEFLNEASVMKAFDTAHVVRLLGVVSRGQPTLVVMELMANGDLKSYLRSHRPDAEKPRSTPPTLARIMQMAMEIADGMAYLSAKKFVHRDLAARNCMVAGDLTVKVGDFGMTRDIYETDYYRKGSKGLLPVRWMSPESLKDGVFTSSSDIWSYGVVLWEMATLASQPYQGLSNDQVLRYVIDGGVMERPENCPDKLYQLMQLTWQHRPQARPTFLQLVDTLFADASPTFRTSSFFCSHRGKELLRQTQPTTAVPEEPEQSASPSELRTSWAHTLASLGSDSSMHDSPRGSARASPTSHHSSVYRDFIRLKPFERTHDPCETEALVVAHARSAPSAPPLSDKGSPPPAPNGYPPRANNGNPSSLSTSRC